MPQYTGTVCVTYYQEFVIDADDDDEARMKMVEAFDINKSDCGPYEVYDLRQVEVLNLEDEHD